MDLNTLFAFIAGGSAKIYDDLIDNPLFRTLKKKNKTLLEGLKGLHYISFTTVSLQSPVFFLVNYIVNGLACLMERSSYTKPYEKSLFYSFFILFLPVLYKISHHGFDITSSYENIILIIIGTVFAVGEAYIFKEEVSLRKLFSRIFFILFIFCSIYIYSSVLSNSLIYMLIYLGGYMLISILVQYYSLFMV
jgi:hypothetical protein